MTQASMGAGWRVALGLTIVASSGCAYLQSPFADDPQYRRGEKPSYTMAQINTIGESDCSKPPQSATCIGIGKLVLTKPSENLSFQFFVPDGKGGSQGKVITCVAPAEAGKTISTSNALSVAVPARVGGSATAASAAASSSVSEALVVLKSIDAASQYVATASFANCLAFASGMYDAASAAENQKTIFNNAVPIAAGASEPAK